MTYLAVWTLVFQYLVLRVGSKEDTVRLAVLAPNDDSQPFSLAKVYPAAKYAVKMLMKQGRRRMDVLYRDTECSSTYGPLAAFSLYNGGLADVFLGPVCPYVLAPVARYTAVWGLPILTAAGQNDNFDQKEPHYRLLTRINGSYSQIGKLFVSVLQKFSWSVLGLLFHNYEDRTLGNSNCYFSLGAVYTAFGRRPFYKDFDETKDTVDYKLMLEEVSQRARGLSIDALRKNLDLKNERMYPFHWRLKLITKRELSEVPALSLLFIAYSIVKGRKF